ncbi:hypothetical protein ACFOGI_09700 [Virgibacillus xinjiangensis]|uniref:WYL domain-containing protein n=1 Tax=Virgibacillus xinjiangensis TaxID=393090 RepID=A0ABV7CWP9_9BACI
MKELFTRISGGTQKLEMIYLSGNGQISQRIIRVVKVEGEYVLAYCYTKKEVRKFKLDRILSAYPVRRKVGA